MKLNEMLQLPRVEAAFVVLKASKHTASNGPYVKLQLGLFDEHVEGKLWQYNGALPEVGTVIELLATVDEYKGVQSLNVRKWKLADQNKYADMLQVYNNTWEHQIETWTALVGRLPDSGYKEIANKAMEMFEAQWKIAPAAISNHHNFPGGLMQHSIEVASMAYQQAAQLSLTANRNYNLSLVVVGGLLHDIGKIRTYSWKGPAIIIDPKESLLGHIVIGMQVVDDILQELSYSPDCIEGLMIKHIIASHHGKLEWGSPVLPATPEAQIVSSSDLMSFRTAVMNELTVPENSVLTEPVYTLDRTRVYKGAY